MGSPATKKLCQQECATQLLNVFRIKVVLMYPYVGIIQIRLWVKATQLTLSLLSASSPFLLPHFIMNKYGVQSITSISFTKKIYRDNIVSI